MDYQTERLSHSKLINLLGAFSGSILMFVLTVTDKMSEGYFGIYMAAVGLTAIGYKYATQPSRNSNRHKYPDDDDSGNGSAKAY